MANKKRVMPRRLYQVLKFIFIYYAFFLAAGCLTLIYFGLTKQRYDFFLLAILIVYLLPPLTHRLMNYFFPLRQGATLIDPNEYNPWINSFRLQKIYVICPQLERLLFLIPGLYNSWLRLWGSKIGKNVYLLPGVEIVDRGNVNFGDHVFIGNKTYISPHVAMTKNGKMYVYVKDVVIGKGSFVGAFCTLGPGTNIPPLQSIPAGSYFTLNSSEPDGTRKA
jgi:acetyltransferase-like isoleucine patch superfamily enzyme